jgi:cell division protein FtsL
MKKISEKTRITLSIATFIIMLIFIISSATAAVTWKNEIEHKIELNSIQFDKLISSLDPLKNKINEHELFYAEIKTELKWIKDALMYIMEELK